jgi:hypothetical protein
MDFVHDEDSNGSDDFITSVPSTATPVMATAKSWMQMEDQVFQSFAEFTKWKSRDDYGWHAQYKRNIQIPGTKQMNYHVFKCSSCSDNCTAQVFCELTYILI